MKTEMCKTCIHNKLCMKDKNIIGMDLFCPPHPMLSTPEERKEAWEKFEKRKKEGFPCEDYFSNDVVEVIRCKDCKHWQNGHLCKVFSRFGTIETDEDGFCYKGEEE